MADGGCHCGAVRFSTNGEPRHAAYCHCADCRRVSGAPVAVFVAFRWDDVAFSGEAQVYRSSPHVIRRFCPACGTSLTYEDERLPGDVHLAIGAFDEPERFPPWEHAFDSDRIAWFDVADSLLRHARFSRQRPT